jgi:hypothetical protein
MGANYYSKLVIGVKLSSVLEDVASSVTKYNPDTGAPYQIPLTKYKMFGELLDYPSESKNLGEDDESDSRWFHCVTSLWDLIEYGTRQWKEEIVFGVEVKSSDFDKNLQSVSLVEIEDARTQVTELLRPYHPDLEPTLHLILKVSY